jgi:hypothetical protein
MEIDIFIDQLTPCLIERKTGNIINTTYKEIGKTDIRTITKGWRFNWKEPFKQGYSIYGLMVHNYIEGLIAFKAGEDCLDVGLVESNPLNVGSNGTYYGVGAHLFAIAAVYSFKMGYEGYMRFTAKTNLIEHYRQHIFATQIGNSRDMYLDENSAKKLIDIYYKKEAW